MDVGDFITSLPDAMFPVPTCPRCGSTDVSPPYTPPELVGSGLEDPEWYCDNCGEEWK